MTNANKHYVFVYGSLKEGFSNNRVLTSPWFGRGPATISEKYGQGITMRQDFTMVHMGGFPGVVNGGGTQAIWGEVWSVSDFKLEWLDQMEHVPTMYNRIEVEVVLDDGELVKAFMYVLSDTLARNVTGRKEPEVGDKDNRIELLDIDGVTVANWMPSYWESASDSKN